jgi:hypothetical protein
MSDRDLLYAAASATYQHCEDAKAALSSLNENYQNSEFQTKDTFLSVLGKIDRSAPDDTTLRRGLNATLSKLFDEILNIWFAVAHEKVQQCEALFRAYESKVDGTQNTLVTVALAPASLQYKNKIDMQIGILESQNAVPPVLGDPLSADWSLHLAAIKGANNAIILLSGEMADWIGKAEKESREKTSHRRAWIALAVSFCGGGGLLGIVDHWANIKSLLGF